MNTPITLICGPAGSGKDTLAGMLAKLLNGVCIAQADPMKRFAAKVFGFDENQLWGPSEARNAVDGRYVADVLGDSLTESDVKRQIAIKSWESAAKNLRHFGPAWVRDVLPDLESFQQNAASQALWAWFVDVAKAHGFLIMMDKDDRSWYDKDMDRYAGVAYVATPGIRQLTPRYVLQTLGTEWGRKVSPSMWSEYAVRASRALLAGGCSYDRVNGVTTLAENRATPDKILAEQTRGADFVVITDGRFRNEIVNVKAVGGSAVLVVSPVKGNDAVEKAGVAGHRSEAELGQVPTHFFDAIVCNDKERGLEALQQLAHTLVNQTTKPTLYATAWPDSTGKRLDR